MTENKYRRPFDGIVVIDMTHILSGPYCAMLLGDMGASVYKIEKPGRGDTTRGTPPFFGKWSHYFLAVNRNKKSVCIDVKKEKGKYLIREIAKKADVIISNFRPKVMDTLGLSYESLKEINPGIIYCSISGFGEDGPLADKAAFDAVTQAMTGIMSVTGEPGGAPLRCGISIGDVVAGTFCYGAISTALYVREKTGVGQKIDVGMFDCLVSYLTYYATLPQATGKLPEKAGSMHATSVPLGAFKTKDGYIVIAAFNQGFWLKLCDGLGKPEWKDDPRFKTMKDRQVYRNELMNILNEIVITKTSSEWSAILDNADVPCGPVLNIPEVLNLEHTKKRNLVHEIKLDDGRKVSVTAQPVKFSGLETGLYRNPPELGQHTKEALCSELSIISEKEYLEAKKDNIVN